MSQELNKTFNSFLSNTPLPENLFKNPEPGKGLDANLYGLVLNIRGVVINDFLKQRTLDENIGNDNIFLKDIFISDLNSNPKEIIGLSNTNEIDNKKEAYGKDMQRGPVGGIIDINEILDKNGKYKGNVLSNAQVIVGQYQKKNVTNDFLKWISGEYDNISKLTDKNTIGYYFVRSRDSMGHIMKGNIGLFISGGKNIIGENINIYNIDNNGTFPQNIEHLIPIVPEKQGTQPYKKYEILLTASENININNNPVNNTVL